MAFTPVLHGLWWDYWMTPIAVLNACARAIIVAVAVLLVAPVVLAHQTDPVARDHARVALVAERATIEPGGSLRVALNIQHEPEWHTYWINPGDSGLPTKLTWTLPEGVSAGAIEWPLPARKDFDGLVNIGYDGDLLLPVTISADAGLAVGTAVDLKVKASWLICRDICIPGDAELSLPIRVVAASDHDAPADPWRARLAVLAADAPKRDPGLSAALIDAGERIDIVLRGLPADVDPTAVEVFPAVEQVLANPRGDASREADGAIRISTPKSDYFVAMPAELELVAAVSRGESRDAYALTAIATTAPAADAGSTAASASAAAPPADGSGGSLLVAVGLALIGGLILNLMPCVFPVLALKALGIADSAHAPATARRHGLLYLAGVLAAFLALGGLLIALRAGGEALGWGFQMQVPWVVGALALLLFAMGLSLSGVFTLGGRLMNVGAGLASGRDGSASFWNGVLAVIVASPCTAPFMGPALGFAVTQSAPLALAVFAALGVGLALPIVALSFYPRLASLLPRPGAWMDTFKQAMAFPLYLTAVWLAWVLGRQAGVDALAVLLIGATALALGVWLIGSSASGNVARVVGVTAIAGAIACVALADRFALPAATQTIAGSATAAPAAGVHGGIGRPWRAFEFAELRAAGEPVLVNMTAAWCLTCLANERVALSSDAFADALTEHGVHYLEGDWTHRDADITRYLATYGRNGVPLYVLYPRGGGDGEVLPQLLTPDFVLEKLAAAGAPAGALPNQSSTASFPSTTVSSTTLKE